MQSPATAAPAALARAALVETGMVRLQVGSGGSPAGTPQALGTPPPPQVWGEAQRPPEARGAVGPPPPPQVWGEAQLPHEATVRGAPQLSAPLTLPQLLARRPQKAASV